MPLVFCSVPQFPTPVEVLKLRRVLLQQFGIVASVVELVVVTVDVVVTVVDDVVVTVVEDVEVEVVEVDEVEVVVVDDVEVDVVEVEEVDVETVEEVEVDVELVVVVPKKFLKDGTQNSRRWKGVKERAACHMVDRWRVDPCKSVQPSYDSGHRPERPRMDIGTFLLMQSPSARPSQEIFARGVELAQAAESLGFRHVWPQADGRLA